MRLASLRQECIPLPVPYSSPLCRICVVTIQAGRGALLAGHTDLRRAGQPGCREGQLSHSETNQGALAAKTDRCQRSQQDWLKAG
eukprot:scaffold590_cov383-Prasinococcus_capsulatus_cf.AAC.4